MRRFSFSLFLSLFIFFLAPVQANDFLEKQEHYQVTTYTPGVVHFKLPVYSRGGYNYFVKTNKYMKSYVYYRLKGDTSRTTLFHFRGEMNSDGYSANDAIPYGRAYVGIDPYMPLGEFVLTNYYDGQSQNIPKNGKDSLMEYKVTKTQEYNNDNDYVTWLEIDWYPPAKLDKDTFDIGVDVHVSTRFPDEDKANYHFTNWILKPNVTGNSNIIDAQIMTPYFNALNESGSGGYGTAIIQYSLFYEPFRYMTTQGVVKTTSDQSGNIIVQTTDTAQPNFAVNFEVYINKESGTVRTLRSNPVTIPAYHRIYDFTAAEERDSTDTYTGKTLLTWKVKNPGLPDLVDGDYMEVQRAFKKDFSDAESIELKPMVTNSKASLYSLVDENRASWTGNATVALDTALHTLSVEKPGYALLDVVGDTAAILDLTLSSSKVVTPGATVYYRVRRASAAAWGWTNHDFARSTQLVKHNFLAPLSESQPTYTPDKDYNKNHKVHFSIKLENKEVTVLPIDTADCTLSYSVVEDLSETVKLELALDSKIKSSTFRSEVQCALLDKDLDLVGDEWWSLTEPQTRSVPIESRLYVRYRNAATNNQWKYETYPLDHSARLTFTEDWYQWAAFGEEYPYISNFQFERINALTEELAARIRLVEPALKTQMVAELNAERSTTYGRCMWDRTARLVLVRSSEEHPEIKAEYIIPQDSIKRQSDGSWIAYYTDIANEACTHYTYAVRIDQSSADLHVQDSIDLQPKAIAGENLYYDEAATITSFSATQGAAQTELKRGVLLNWQASSEAVDEYMLLRREQGSNATPDTLYTGLDVTYFDATAKPSVHYDYTIVASYECNGKHSENNASAEGWRTPYGEISGAILMPDNSGIAGVHVALQKEDSVITTLITDATGAFRFDSLTYDLTNGTQYVIVPTATYGTFRYNNTSSPTAPITLTKDNAVALGINFENADGVRLSGRALYNLSSIPVAGAMFVLNSDTIRRNGVPLTTGVDGNFELTLTKSQPYTLQIVKPGHTFVNEGYLEVTTGERTFALTKPLDGVRFYDRTKVRLVGRVAAGIDQRDLPEAFGVGHNYLGDDLTLVLQLEGDNTAHLVHDPQDLTRDTLMNTFDQKVYNIDPLSAVKERTVGTTTMLTEKKRITIYPDPTTGEYAVDLFPVKYKVIQATATGYATLFASGQASETFDLTNAPLVTFDPVQGSDSVHYNAVYDRIYRSPVQLSLKQYIFGLEQEGLGEPQMEVSSFSSANRQKVDLYYRTDGEITYLLGHPVYYANRKYQFAAQAYEDYYYNNISSGEPYRVPQRGGSVTIHNGLHSTKKSNTYTLDQHGRNNAIWLEVDNISTEQSGTNALRTVSAVLKVEGASVETDGFQAFVAGNYVSENGLTYTQGDVTIFDIVRDPGGNGSSAWVEEGQTYSASFTETYDFKAGVTLKPTWSKKVDRDVGVITGTVAAGTYIGQNIHVEQKFAIPIPIVASYSLGKKYTYTFTANHKIATSTKKNKAGIGANADVFLGMTHSVVSGKAKTVDIINDSLFRARKPAIDAGAMRVMATGTVNGQTYHLVTGEKVVLGSAVENTFAYSQHYILNSIIPELILQRYSLLMNFPDSATAQAAADAAGQPVYWYIDSTQAVHMQDTLAANTYRMIVPSQSTEVYTDRVKGIENILVRWFNVLYNNEKAKVEARYRGQRLGTFSANYGNSYSRSDSYSSLYDENSVPIGGTGGNLISKAGTTAVASGLKSYISEYAANADNIVTIGGVDNFGKNLGEAFNSFYNRIKEYDDQGRLTRDNPGYEGGGGDGHRKGEQDMLISSAVSKFEMKWDPVLDFSVNQRQSVDITKKKSTGFTLVPDDQGDITVTVYRAPADSAWLAQVTKVVNNVSLSNYADAFYGGYVFYTEAGSTYCVHEQEEKTMFYQPGTVLSHPTVMLAKPELSIDAYEQTNIPADQRAMFRVEIRNAGEIQYGMAGSGTVFTLSFIGASNPNGAKVFLGGAALNQTVNYFLNPGQSISQIIEVERGLVDDYENLQLMLSVADCAKTNTMLNFSVHFTPESSPVAIAAPRQGWVMNTLSPKDSIGYYLPIDINGFNIRHKNFDHIEFQYKLASQSDDDWTNQCSFYADEELYNLASGNKAMIENGRITPFRFYGERDPMEQQYDLRAVSFCRHGSGFVTKSSPVISGTKDTRPPRVFGAPQPANAILGVGDDLKLRFNEAIAGNYLDEDNNFQLLGVTNATGITTGTSLHFDGSQDSYVGTKVGRTLSQHSISIDMLVKPTEPNRDEVFFSHEEKDGNVLFGKTADNRLYADINGQRTYSQPLQDPMLDFTRVIVTYDNESKEIRFYAGTLDVTNNANEQYDLNDYKANAPLVFGRGFKGNMLEVRVWTKVLTPEEIALTHLKRLSGYERELAAYYPMNEGRGETLSDKANGATLYTHGATWTNKSGISLALTADQRVQLNSNVLSRSNKQDFTLMFWFKAQEDGTLFSCDKFSITTAQANAFADNEWHHYVLAVNRTMNSASTFVDGELIDQRSSDSIPSLGGAMYLGGDGFAGNFDEFVLFEQALPKTLMDEYSTMAPVGDEMGIIAYLPFSTLKQNASGVLEQVFSINDQRIFRDANGKVVNKVIPLVLTAADAYADKANYAPLRDHGQLTKLKFDWAFNNDELLININMADREINKQEMYITVRDVEDLHGNPMVSPATWTAFVDRNALKWENHQITMNVNDNTDASSIYDIQIINNSGKRHQYAIESMPSWMTVNRPSGSMDPMEEKSLRFTFSNDIPVGVYSDIIYLSDEDGLLEPLRIEYTVAAVCPYDEPDEHKYPLNMSICGEVKIGDKYDTDSDNRVIALYRNECVGMTNIDFDQTRNTSKVHMSIYGNESMNGKTLSFLLWQASTGKVLPLTVTPDTVAVFTHGAVYGCGNEQIVRFTTGGTETQNIALEPGWNWVSYNVDLNAENSLIKNVMTASDQWTEGDIIKTPSTQDFITYSSRRDEFIGTFKTFDYHNIYMFYTKAGNTLRISGNKIPEAERFIIIAGNKQWTELPCLFDQTTAITDALADYYEQATPGDIVKSHGHFAYFSTDGKWEGDLNALRPGEGYLFRRLGQGDVTIHFYEQKANAPKKVPAAEQPAFRGNSAMNMTMICRIDESQESRVESIRAFIGDELVGVATQIDSLYFLTIQTDITGTIRFETEDGNALMPIINQQSSIINYVPNAHHGSLKAPIILIPGDNRPYKIIENNHVIIIRNNEKYSIDGKKL